MTKDDDIEKTTEKVESIPKDAVSEYLENHQAMADSIQEFDILLRMRTSIGIGSALLPNSYEELKEHTRNILSNRMNYIGNRQMVYDSIEGTYSISTGGKEGMVKVRPEEVKEGTESLLNQQANEIIPRLQNLEQVIYEELLALKILDKKTMDLEKLAKQKFLGKVKKW